MFNFAKFQILINTILATDDIGTLPAILILISLSVLVVVCFRKINLSPVLGYLCTGVLVGRHGLDIISVEKTTFIGEFGVVFLLFIIGLELSFARLKDMRKYVLGLGSLQITGIFLAFLATLIFFFKIDYKIAIIIAGGISLSSTAVVLQLIKDLNKQATQLGRISLAILLQQDFAVIPLIVLVPILASNADGGAIFSAIALCVCKALLALCAIFIVGRIFLRPLYRIICSISPSNNEVFIATTLLIVLSAAWSTEYFGLSLALGAFVAGILVAETEYRHQAEESISPFKDILLGLFFMSVGMTIDVAYIYKKLDLILLYTSYIVVVKFIITAGSCYLFKVNKGVSLQIGLLLAQGSEFSFVLCKLAMMHQLFSSSVGEMFLVVTTISIALTPMLTVLGTYLSKKFDRGDLTASQILKRNTADLNNHVVVLGLTQESQMASNMLSLNDLKHVIIERNEALVKRGIDNDLPIYLGDPTDLNILEGAGIKRSKGILVSSYSSMLDKTLRLISANFPQIPIVLTTKDMSNAARLYELGVTTVIPLYYEAGLELASVFLRDSGFSSTEISRIKNVYRTERYNKVSQDKISV